MKEYFFLITFLVLQLTISPDTVWGNNTEPPNVLMICIDDLNDFIGGMGHPDAITPNLDRLIEKGVLFSNAQCQAPLCGPSRAAVMTGLRPSTTGIYGMIPDNAIKDVNARTGRTDFMHGYFRHRGYYTMGIGKIFHKFAPDGLFDEAGGRERSKEHVPPERMHWGKKDSDAGTATDWGPYPERDDQMPDYRTAAWAVDRLQRQYDKPFFLTVGFFRPHVPWHVPQKWFDLYDTAKIHLPPYLSNDRNDLPEIALAIDDLPMMPTTEWAINNKQWKSIVQGYLACVSFVDHYVGEVLNALEDSQYAENTIVVVWSDHGYRLGEKGTFAKMCLWESATNAPLIFAGPGIPEKRRVDLPVELFSIYPTLTDLCGLPPNRNVEAHSLYPLLKGSGQKWQWPAITTWGRNNHAITTKDYRYIRYEDGSEELYQIKKDPNEWHNLAKVEKYDKVMASLRELLPTTNVKWASESEYKVNAYFKKQKREQSEIAD